MLGIEPWSGIKYAYHCAILPCCCPQIWSGFGLSNNSSSSSFLFIYIQLFCPLFVSPSKLFLSLTDRRLFFAFTHFLLCLQAFCRSRPGRKKTGSVLFMSFSVSSIPAAAAATDTKQAGTSPMTDVRGQAMITFDQQCWARGGSTAQR